MLFHLFINSFIKDRSHINSVAENDKSWETMATLTQIPIYQILQVVDK
jgi:hypothetical protein